MGVRLEYRGLRPGHGLVCSNHLSYLDIAVFAAAVPCVFVSKAEVQRWPLFGFFARAGGTIFIDRQSRASTEHVADQIGAVLQRGVPVLLFPEGTSTDGSTLQRFHPSLLEPAVQSATEIGAAAIGYRVRGLPERAMCWYGEMGFLPHLLRTLTYTGIRAEVDFYPEPVVYKDRKVAALDLSEKVEAMRTRMKDNPRS